MRKYLLLLLAFTSCSSQQDQRPQGVELTAFQGTVMTVPYKIEIGEKLSSSEQMKVEEIIRTTFQEINNVYNKWNPESEVSRINQAGAGVAVEVSPGLISFLQKCQTFVELSNGRFDPTIESIQALWKAHLEEGTSPSQSEIDQFKGAVGWQNLVIRANSVVKKHRYTRLDLGGIAKGYCVDLLVERLKKRGYPNVFVEWGGEIRANGKHPQGRSWAVFISNLEDLNPEHALAYVPLTNQAIATSGDYLQQWKIGKTTYFHVFDPKTLRPLQVTENSIASASVLTKECMTADALATMLLMCNDMEEAKALSQKMKERYPDTTFWLMSRKEEAHAR